MYRSKVVESIFYFYTRMYLYMNTDQLELPASIHRVSISFILGSGCVCADAVIKFELLSLFVFVYNDLCIM